VFIREALSDSDVFGRSVSLKPTIIAAQPDQPIKSSMYVSYMPALE